MYWVSLQAVSNGSNELEISKPSSNDAGESELTSEVNSSVETSHSTAATSNNLNTETSINTHSIVPSQKIVPPSIPSSADQLIEVTLALALVVGLIYGVAWLVKRNKSLAPSAGIPMRTLSVLPMGIKEKIILVEVGGKQLLLGMTPHQINTLATFDEPIIDPTLSNEKPFSTRLKEMLNQGKGVDNKIVEPKD